MAKPGLSLPRPSRRAVVVAVTAAPLAGTAESAPTEPDAVVAACEAWLAWDIDMKRLSRRWQRIERKLARERDWLTLSDEEQARLPEARLLADLEARSDELHDDKQTLLALLPTLTATSFAGLAGKLAVAAVEVCPDENELAHKLIASALRDLKALAPELG